MKDPVCGMEVDEGTAHKTMHGGREYLFCSMECKESFEEKPEDYSEKKIGRKGKK